jgi:phosphatidylserine decarboxylase
MLEKHGLKLIAFELLFTPLVVLNLYVALIIAFAIAVTIFFFRDPYREIGSGVVSPADGKIDYMSDRRVEIFMNVFDCHVNRAPVDGVVKKIVYTRGSKFPAFIRREDVEKNEIYIENDDGLFKVVQIAGFFARRIFCYVKEGDVVKKGDKIGIIAFGSRVVLEIPEGYAFVKKVGDRVKAGETIAVKMREV